MPAPDYSVEIAALETALGTGELTVESNGERVTYRSADDLQRALGYFRQLAAVTLAPSPPSQWSYAAYDRT